MTLEEFLKTIPYFCDTYYYNPVTTSHDAVEKCWEFRQSEIDILKAENTELLSNAKADDEYESKLEDEIDELKSRISELEKELDELDDKYLELKAQG